MTTPNADDIRWAGFTHAELYAIVHSPEGDPQAGANAEQPWKDVSTALHEIEGNLVRAISGSEGEYTGTAADQTRESLRRLTNWALDATANAEQTGQAARALYYSAAFLRARMPPPTDYVAPQQALGATDMSYAIYGEPDMAAAETADANNAARARDLMFTYTTVVNEQVPLMGMDFDPPQVTVADAPAPPPPGGPAVSAPGLGGGVGTAAVGPAGDPGIAPAPPGSPPPGSPAAPPGGSNLPPGTPSALPPVLPPVSNAPAPPGAGDPNRSPTPAPATTTSSAVAPPNVPAPGGGQGSGPQPGPWAPPPGTSTVPGGAGAPGGVRPPGGTGAAGGVRPPGGTGATGGGVPGAGRPNASGPTRSTPPPQPTWRQLVERHSGGPGAGSGAGPGSGADPNRLPGGTAARAGSEIPPRPGLPPERAGATGAEPVTRSGAPRPAAPTPGGMYPPTAGAAGGAPDQERRRAPYLIDDSDAFTDDRWFPPPVITPDS